MMPEPREPEIDPAAQEIARLYGMYVDVDRQLTGLWDESLDQATDALMQRPDLARALLGGVAAGPGRFAATVAFAQPPR